MRNVEEKKLQQISLKKYFTAFGLFLLFMMLSILYFFYCVQVNVAAAAERTIQEHVKRQCDHIREIMNIQYEHLEGIADYISSSKELLSEDNRALLRAVCRTNRFGRMAIIGGDGVSTYEDGAVKNVASREYFQEAMKGKRALSDPLESRVDGEWRVIMAVPVLAAGRAKGVLGGSYDLGALSHFLFEDIYDGEGYSLVVTADGEVVSFDGSEEVRGIGARDNFFDYYGAMNFLGGSSMEEVRADFDSRAGRCLKMRDGSEEQYLVYEPLELKGWMLCYVVPVSKVEEGYGFIRYYELILTMVLLGGVAVLLCYIWNENQKEKRALMEYAHTDVLTGVLNKDTTEEETDQWLEDKRSSGSQVLMMLDIDNFKTINDVYGHAAGDEALRQVGALLRQVFREDDIIGRVGGDEFVVLMKNITEEETALNRAEDLCRRFREITLKELKGRPLSCSIGMACAPEYGTTYQQLYVCADCALYQSKKKGRNGYTMYRGEHL